MLKIIPMNAPMTAAALIRVPIHARISFFFFVIAVWGLEFQKDVVDVALLHPPALGQVIVLAILFQ